MFFVNRTTMRFFLILFCIIMPTVAFAQTKGTISGKVIDAESGEVLRRATVSIVGTQMGAFTDVKGEYKLRSLNPGTYSLQVRYVGYEIKQIDNIEVKEGGNTVINVVLASSVKKTEEIVVEARRENNNEAAILAQRKNASQVSDGISIEEIKRTPDSDAGQSLRRVSGVTLVNDKFVYVRGVSERYSNTTLNGTALATTEPDKKAFAFDMFPSEFLENANVAKSFSPDLPGNFAGGLVQLNTVDFPAARSFKISFGTSMSDNVTFDKKFITYGSGSQNWFGYEDGSRSLPGSVPSSPSAMKDLTNRLKSDDEATLRAATDEWSSLSKSFNNKAWSRDTISAPLNGSINMSYSDIFNLGGSDLGIIASAMYGNSYSYNDIYRATLNSDATVYNYNRGTVSTFSTNLGGLLNIAYKIGDNNSISLKNTYNNAADDESTIMLGRKDQSYTRQFGFQFVQKTLFASQLGGEHNLSFLNNSLLNWKLGVSNSKRDEPDFKRVRYSRSDTTAPFRVDIYDLAGNGYQAGRFFSNLEEQALTGALDFTLPLNTFKIKTGILIEQKDREFLVRSLTINKSTYLLKNYYDPDFGYVVQNYGDEDFYNDYFTQDPEFLFDEANYTYDRLGLGEETKPSDSYRANESLIAGYIMGDLPFDISGHKLRIITGARIESSTQNLESFYPIASNGSDSTFVDANDVDVLPALNIVYELTKTMNFRASASQTLTRPSLREYAPFTFYDFYFQGDVTGNPSLKRALIQNYDLRWEWFTNPGEVISASIFYKSFKDAIEETVIGTSSNIKRTFANADGTAYNYGFELELRKNLGFLASFLSPLSFNMNLAIIKSEITVEQNSVKDTRSMWGQSPYSLNLGLFYYNNESGTSVNLGYNTSGKRIMQVADISRYSQKDPHIYEMSRNSVDLSISQSIAKMFEIKFVAKDLLNEKVRWEQLGNEVASTVRGRAFSFGISYKL